MHPIALIPIGGIGPSVADFLSLSLPEILQTSCRVLHTKIDIAPCFNIDRRQYHSTDILRRLLPHVNANGEHVLGIMEEDLYIPILTFVYGEAQLGGKCALVSCHRLHESFYGMPEDETIFLNRCEKEAVHELGHTLGLTHCNNFECVMRYSTSVDGIDLKRNVFCPRCSEMLDIPSLW